MSASGGHFKEDKVCACGGDSEENKCGRVVETVIKVTLGVEVDTVKRTRCGHVM